MAGRGRARQGMAGQDKAWAPMAQRYDMDLTIVVGLDARTLSQFTGAWPTWRHFKPWLRESSFLFIGDANAGDWDWWRHQLRDVLPDVPQHKIVLWQWGGPEDSQRERMLTAWVKVPSQYVATSYWAKIDSDVVATGPQPWPLSEWFEDSPGIIAPPWGYTKARPSGTDWLGILDAWGDTVPQLAAGLRLDLPAPAPGQKRIGHPRVCGWCNIYRTNFSYLCAELIGERLPVPSEDTYHWYCAFRLREAIIKVKMSRHGWATISNDRARAKLIDELLAGKECC